VIRPFQLGKINVLGWNVLDGRIVRFAKRQSIAGIGNHTARDGYDKRELDSAGWKSDDPDLEL
jgi:hypothetical protein